MTADQQSDQKASYEYDVAISFLARDEPLALQLQTALAPLKVFVYAKAQEELAGRDGVEAFRGVFRHRAQVAVVLFRPPWGTTPWTRVEATAIEDYCLEAGWEHLMFVALEKAQKPKWVPDSHLYLDFESFGIADLVGAVKAKCATLGIELRPPSPVERAKQIAAEEAYRQETEQLIHSTPRPLHEAAAVLFAAVEQRLAEIQRDTGWRITQGSDKLQFVAYTENVSLQLSGVWERADRRGEMDARIYRGRVLTPQELGRFWTPNDPVERVRKVLLLTRLREYGWCWQEKDRVLSTEAAADWLVNEFISARTRERDRESDDAPPWPRSPRRI